MFVAGRFLDVEVAKWAKRDEMGPSRGSDRLVNHSRSQGGWLNLYTFSYRTPFYSSINEDIDSFVCRQSTLGPILKFNVAHI